MGSKSKKMRYKLKQVMLESVLWLWKRIKKLQLSNRQVFWEHVWFIFVFPTASGSESTKYTTSINSLIKRFNVHLSQLPFNSDPPAAPSCSNSLPTRPNFFNLFIFNWSTIALQYCVAVCNTSTWISQRYVYNGGFPGGASAKKTPLPLQET